MNREEFESLKVDDVLIDSGNVGWNVVFLHDARGDGVVSDVAIHHPAVGLSTILRSEAMHWEKSVGPFFEVGKTYARPHGELQYEVEAIHVKGPERRSALAEEYLDGKFVQVLILDESDFKYMKKVRK